ncbi:ABC transporter permease [Maribacter sp. 4G9]|uniref:ABC transporter permease n=1 Tax=Maribacter sp. 4G9 TaxID=1889777 RepID=UPI000C15BEAB|nr:ABC transporter permease [Maribacter sp. 4G9]PIB31434.1 ABC transporter permease [Maribacter sp. 4G9]
MLKNHLKIAWRNLTKNKQQSIINLLGLTVGTVCCLAIFLYVFDQTGYDQHHENAESIYRITSYFDGSQQNTDDIVSATSSPPIAFALKEDFPEVEEATRVILMDLFFTNPIRSANEQKGAYEKRAYMADSTFFKVFDYKFVEGSKETALDEPTDIVLSSSLAKKLFGSKEALGENIMWGSGENPMVLTVSGVFDEGNKSHLNPNYIVSLNTPGFGDFVRGVNNFATENFAYNYIKLNPAVNGESVEKKLASFLTARGEKDLVDSGIRKVLTLQNITDIHLHSKGIKYQIDNVSDIKYLYFLLTLAVFIQLVACVNFINLSTARANKRAKEIGIRKVVGAARNSLVWQFLRESLMLSFIGILISIPLTVMLLPFINELTQGALTYVDLFNWKIGLLLVSLGTITGFVSGIYPALILSSIKPIQVLKSTINLQSENGNFRKALVVFQFVISIALIAAVILVTQQFHYAQTKDLGFDKENLITVRLNQTGGPSDFNALKEEFLTVPGVTQVTGSGYAPSEAVLMDRGLHLPGTNPENKTLVKLNRISEGYFDTMNIPLILGRDLREGDENQIVVNQATLKVFGISEHKALGSKILQTFDDQTLEFEIVGVARDYHYMTIKEKIAPLMLMRNNDPAWLLLRTKTDDYQQLLGNLEGKWNATVKDTPFTYGFVDQEVGKLYEEEKRLRKIATVFAFLAILISCLGLFGLVSYVAEQKKKEIGIRKVLGASINSVVQLLTKDFLKLVGIAFLIATPVAYYFIQNWLEGYTYHIDVQWWVFVLAGGFALIITILTVGFQSLKSATANPVKSLRTE